MTVICGVFVLNNVLFQLLLLALPTFGAKPINVEAGVLATYGLIAAGISFFAFGESFSVLVFAGLVLSLWLCTLAVAVSGDDGRGDRAAYARPRTGGRPRRSRTDRDGCTACQRPRDAL